jgi:GNAT superfamily N-acetyltransferase
VTLISYETGRALKPEDFIDVLRRSGLAERRPVADVDVIQGMLEHADLLVTAWADELLVGVARSVTDYHYCCYLSDLAVDRAYQKSGIGRELIRRTREQLGPGCILILLSAPAAVGYYPRLGFSAHDSAWVLRPDDALE